MSRETSLSLENGGFTQLDRDGAWRTTPEQYVGAVRRYCDEIGIFSGPLIRTWTLSA
jgi:hypothetical protein